MRHLQRLHEGADGKPISIIGVNIDLRETEGVQPFLDALSISYPNYRINTEELDRVLDPVRASLPFSILVDSQKKVAALFPGWSSEIRRRLETHLQDSADPKP